MNEGKTEVIPLILTGDGPKLSCNLHPVLRFERNVSVTLALTKISFYTCFENISFDENNELRIKPGGGHDWILVQLNSGAYNLDEIYEEIIRELTRKGVKDIDKSFVLEANSTTLRANITLGNGYKVSFDTEHSIAKILGFKSTDFLNQDGRYQGSDVVNINTVTSLFVLCDITRASYKNGKHASFIYNTVINTKPGVRFIDTPTNLVHIPLLLNDIISDINVWVVDQNMRPIKMMNREFVIELNLVLHHHNINLDNTGNVTKRTRFNT